MFVFPQSWPCSSGRSRCIKLKSKPVILRGGYQYGSYETVSERVVPMRMSFFLTEHEVRASLAGASFCLRMVIMW
jgi:hypothetical protein